MAAAFWCFPTCPPRNNHGEISLCRDEIILDKVKSAHEDHAISLLRDSGEFNRGLFSTDCNSLDLKANAYGGFI
jgi:hypothetical protein